MPVIGTDSRPAFVGRARERAALEALLLRPLGAAVLVEGEPGIGKSRLAAEAAALAAGAGAAVLVGHCYDSDPPASLLPLLQMLTAAGPLDSPASFERLAAEVGAPSTAALPAGMGDPRLAFFERIVRRLGAGSGGRPLLLVVEDLQWADADSLLFLNHLVDVRPPGVSLLCTLRADRRRRQPLLEALRARSEVVALGPLSAEEAAALVGSLCDSLREGEVAFLCGLGGGNPFALIELALHLRNSGLLETTTATRAVGRQGLPRALSDLVDTRLDGLDAFVRAVLEAASVIGGEFEPALVAASADLSLSETEDALSLARDDGVLERLAAPGTEVYSFAHPLLRERLYARLGRRGQRMVHARLARLRGDLAGKVSVESLARHQALGLSGTERALAVDTCVRAAERSESVLAFEAAAGFWEMALACAESLPASASAGLLRRLGLALRAAGNWNEALPALEKAAESYEALGDVGAAGEVAAFAGEMHRFRLRLPEAERWLEFALQRLPQAARLRCLALLGSVRVAMDRPEEGLLVLQEALRAGEAAGTVPPDVAYWASFAFTVTGRHEVARLMAERGLIEAQGPKDAVYESLLAGSLAQMELGALHPAAAAGYVKRLEQWGGPRDAVSLVRALLSRCLLESYHGRWQAVSDTCEAWLSEVRLAGRFQVATAQVIWAEAQSCLGDQAGALALLDDALPHLETMRNNALLHRARMLVRSGSVEPARNLVEDVSSYALESQRSQGTRALLADLAWLVRDRGVLERLYTILLGESRSMLLVYSPTSLRRVLGKVAAALGRWDEAFAHFEAARKELEAGGAHWELAMTCLDYAYARGRRARRADRMWSQALETEGLRRIAALGIDPAAWAPAENGATVPAGTTPGRATGASLPLTEREIDVLSLVAAGWRNPEIAQSLHVTEHTVKRALEKVYRKLGVRSRAQAVVRAAGEGLLPLHTTEHSGHERATVGRERTRK